MAKSKTVYRARTTFFTGAHPAPIVEGQDYESDHPAVKASPESFDKIRLVEDRGTVEQATKAPGEKRTVHNDDD